MSLKLFLKENQEQPKNVMYAATETLKDEAGKPLEWEFRIVTQDEIEANRKMCTKTVPDNINKGQYREITDNIQLTAKLLALSVVQPDLNNKELQDSYGVFSPEDLIRKLVYKPGEYLKLTAFYNEINGFTSPSAFNEDVETAKN